MWRGQRKQNCLYKLAPLYIIHKYMMKFMKNNIKLTVQIIESYNIYIHINYKLRNRGDGGGEN